MSYKLSCCSTCDLSAEHLKARDISYICFHFRLGDKEYPDDLGKSIPFEEFYARMAQGEMTSTSQVSISEYLEYFTPYLESGLDILHVCLSSGLSGTYNSAVNAAQIARERFPDRKIYIVDSLGASSGYGLLMDTLADLRDSGMDIDALRDWAEKNRLRVHHWFFSTDLSYYVRGGRISKTSGAVGTLLKICPLLDMDKAGRLVPRSKIPGKNRVIKEIAKRMFEFADGGADYSGKCFLSHSACIDDARAVASLVEGHFGKLRGGKVLINYVGTTIGSHTGPGTVALFFWGPERTHSLT